MIGKTLEKTMTNLLAMGKSERIQFALKNKKAILEQKKSEIIKSMPITYFPSSQERTATKAARKEENSEILDKTIVGNVAMYMDGHLDVQGKGCWKKSLLESQSKFYHTKNHSSKVDDRVGKPVKTYTKELDLKRLGVKSDIKKAEALLMDTTIYKALDEKIFVQYSLDMVNQHSVGMLYVKIKMAANEDSDETEKEYKLWKKYYPKLINPEVADKHGIFFYVEESKLIEISAVTRGSNDITPTLDQKIEPTQVTQELKQLEAANALRETKKNNFYKNLVR